MKRSILTLPLILLIPALSWGTATSYSTFDENFNPVEAVATVNTVLDLSDFSYVNIGFHDSEGNVLPKIPLELSKDPATGEIVATKDAFIKAEVKYGKKYNLVVKAEGRLGNLVDWIASVNDVSSGEVGGVDSYQGVAFYEHKDNSDYLNDDFKLNLKAVNLSELQQGDLLESYLTVSMEVV